MVYPEKTALSTNFREWTIFVYNCDSFAKCEYKIWKFSELCVLIFTLKNVSFYPSIISYICYENVFISHTMKFLEKSILVANFFYWNILFFLQALLHNFNPSSFEFTHCRERMVCTLKGFVFSHTLIYFVKHKRCYCYVCLFTVMECRVENINDENKIYKQNQAFCINKCSDRSMEV